MMAIRMGIPAPRLSAPDGADAATTQSLKGAIAGPIG